MNYFLFYKMADSIFSSAAFWVFIIGLIVLIIGLVLFTISTVSNTWKWGVTITGIVIIFLALIIYLIEYSQESEKTTVVASPVPHHIYTNTSPTSSAIYTGGVAVPHHYYTAPTAPHHIYSAPVNNTTYAAPVNNTVPTTSVVNNPPAVSTQPNPTSTSVPWSDRISNYYNNATNAAQQGYAGYQRVKTDAKNAYNTLKPVATKAAATGEIVANT